VASGVVGANEWEGAGSFLESVEEKWCKGGLVIVGITLGTMQSMMISCKKIVAECTGWLWLQG